MERNLLISRPDNRTYVDENGNFRPAFHIIERDSYTPIEDGYQDTVFVREMDEAGILERVQAAIDYAREQGIPVQVNHVKVKASLLNALVDARGIEIVPGPGDEANAPEWSGPEWVTARISRSRWEADHAWQEKNRRGTADSQRSSPGGSGNSPRPCRRFMRQAGDRFSDLSLCPERTAQKNGCQFGRILTPCRTPDPALRPGSGGWIT